MLKINNLQVSLSDGGKQILNGVDLDVAPGEVHLISGNNGSGKSTLAAALCGHPDFVVTDGSVKFVGEDYTQYLLDAAGIKSKNNEIDVLELEPHQRSLLGLFVAFQYPIEIPGLSLRGFLRLAYNARRKNPLPVFKFNKLLEERAALINYPPALLDRNLNEGFSGGEKKKTEILQLAVLEPRYAVLDETDSGLDKQAVHEVFKGISEMRKKLLPELALIVITHYEKVLEHIQPDHFHLMEDGVITKQSHSSNKGNI